MSKLATLIAQEINAHVRQVNAAITLLDEGSTVPFIARYRKEVTEGLDDGQLRTLEQRLTYLRELETRRDAILKSISEQDKLTPQLNAAINAADTKTRLEDLYLPFKTKRRTKGQIAIEAGLSPLAESLISNPQQQPLQLAKQFTTSESSFSAPEQVLEGAKFILMEKASVDAELIAKVRQQLLAHATLESKENKKTAKEDSKFKDYFTHSERISKVPSHRMLAMLRGKNEGELQIGLNADPEFTEKNATSYCEVIIAKHLGINYHHKPADEWLKSVVHSSWKQKLLSQLETELIGKLKESAEVEAIKVFAANLTALLMASPAGPKVTLGLDPGLRTGSKIAVVDATGKLLDHTTIYPHVPQQQWQQSLSTLATLCKRYNVELISIGNGTASRETDKLVAELIKAKPELKLQKIMVSEAGASVYSASELAANEFPQLDVSIRGAVSIARRLQDPLAELVKIDPKAIGVGQYQHDVNQTLLAKQLDTVIEDCVNKVGVDLNMASAPLLSRVAGLNTTIANNIVKYRDENGAFNKRSELKKVARLGPKAFEQCAGFLRINNGKEALDASGVHPESYSVVKQITVSTGYKVEALIGNKTLLHALNPNDYTNAQFGLPTVTDIIAELDKPGRDPRPEFKTATFKDGVEKITDLKVEMILEGVVSNVTNFGAFVDIGVHQDGLVHISALAEGFVKDPNAVVKAGQIVRVKVTEVDVARKRIALTMRLNDEVSVTSNHASKNNKAIHESSHKPVNQAQVNRQKKIQERSSDFNNSAFADAFANAKKC
ncbi:MAG: Tex family protein [Moritella sp.]|uniref:Tex family protein n=1 Tax=Moritella sp. TaxID=78556 RepID=UPI0029B12F49|nr:Tex family protein [Moritella sp.]MDX2321781.1 Tex family protein [Moritella sp.]